MRCHSAGRRDGGEWRKSEGVCQCQSEPLSVIVDIHRKIVDMLLEVPPPLETTVVVDNGYAHYLMLPHNEGKPQEQLLAPGCDGLVVVLPCSSSAAMDKEKEG